MNDDEILNITVEVEKDDEILNVVVEKDDENLNVVIEENDDEILNVVVEVEKDDEMLNVVMVKENDEILNEIVTDFSHDKVIMSDSDVKMMLIVPYEKQDLILNCDISSF